MENIKPSNDRQSALALLMVWLMVSVLSAPLLQPTSLVSETSVNRTQSTPWQGGEQPWPQYARTPTHNQTVPDHGPDGGPGAGSVVNITSLARLENPVVNWHVFEDTT